jgi:hypothetical protein
MLVDRMPPAIGDFTSQFVYNNQLKSFEKHPIQPDTPSCFFVNVASGKALSNDTSFYVSILVILILLH